MSFVLKFSSVIVDGFFSSLGECPPNWIVGNDGTGCFFVSQIQLNFTDANIWCQNSQSRLIEIVETKLFTALQTLKNFRFRLNDFFWIGLREIGPNRCSSSNILTF